MKEIQTERGRLHAALVHQQSLIAKLASGEYPTEETKCFCGAEEGIQIREFDRYGIPHRLLVCEECALIRATPRMTPEAYTQFYNNEYRHINSCQASDTLQLPDDAIYEKVGGVKSKSLLEWLDDWAIDLPKIVIDWGCHVGGMLDPFAAKGCETWGIEIDVDAAEVARSKGHKVVSTIDELIALGVKANFVIMQDVIEHLCDLNEVKKVSQILAPKGHFYVWTPGFFTVENPAGLFQIAHTYQFCSRTLEYVMFKLGFAEVYIDEDIKSLWQWAGDNSEWQPEKPQEWVEHITDMIFHRETRKAPRFRGVCKFTPKLLYSNVKENLAAKIPDIYELSGKSSGDVIILGGGPSVDSQVQQIKDLQAQGYPLITIARMYPWCAIQGIAPDYVVSLDCSEEQEKSFTHLQPGVRYLLASVTRPSLIQMLKDGECYIFDTKENDKMRTFRAQNGYTVATVINAGGSVTITSISVAMNLGFTDFHVFGLDLMVAGKDQTHAKGIAGESITFDYAEVEINGENILTTPSFLEFAQQTLDLADAGHLDGLLKSIKFYGESLMNRLWDCQWHDENPSEESKNVSI